MPTTTDRPKRDLSFHPVRCEAPQQFSPAQIQQYNEQGYIAGITLFEGEQLQQVRAFFARAKAELTSFDEFHSFHHTMPELYDVVTQPLLVGYLQDLLGPNVVCFVSQYVCKEPGNTGVVEWHQDAAYNPTDAKSVIVWLAVDDAFIENGCMWFIPGSHRLGIVAYEESVAAGKQVRDAEKYGEKIPIELKAGQAVFFSDLLLHSSPANRSTQQRGGLTMTFTSAEVATHDVPGFNVTNQESVLCSGEDRENNWAHNPRPDSSCG